MWEKSPLLNISRWTLELVKNNKQIVSARFESKHEPGTRRRFKTAQNYFEHFVPSRSIGINVQLAPFRAQCFSLFFIYKLSFPEANYFVREPLIN